MPTSVGNDRREYPRQPAGAHVCIVHSNNHYDSYLKDISLNGARLILPQPCAFEKGDRVSLVMSLSDLTPPASGKPNLYFLDHQVQQVVRLKGTMVFRHGRTMGVEYQPVNEVDQLLLVMLLSRP